jgi:lysophospholipase L1-like esterase
MEENDQLRILTTILFLLFINVNAESQIDSLSATSNSQVGIDSNEIIQRCDSLTAYHFDDFRRMDTSLRGTYPFVDYSKNNYRFYTKESQNFERLYGKLEQLIHNKEGKLNFYHIGGSHLQADIYTNDVREYFQLDWPGLQGERGWVFPFDLAGTNNPGNYEFKSPNKWEAYRSIPHQPSKYDVDYGLLGALITCPDSVITIRFEYDRTISKPPIQHLRIFHNKGEFPYWTHLGKHELLVYKREHDLKLGTTDIYFTDPVDSINIQFQRTGAYAPELEIYGFLLMNELPGISYTSIGINGAGLYTYLDNIRFEEQLKTYPPDFFAYSVGTNDGNVPYTKFNPQVYKRNLEKMMQMVLRANPDCALLLTVPNDSYYRRRYLNKNIARERTVIIELAKEYDMAVWDLYGVMGELGSSKTWRNNNLMRRDLIHFTFEGYHFKGDLYIDAFLKYMDQMATCRPVTIE